MSFKHIFCCSKGHETEGEHVEFGHVWECPVCHEVCVKVYPQGGGREWVVIPEDKVIFHGLVPRNEE
jgi:hypothetical protein